MDLEKIKELALANGFKLKEQASGNMDLNAYVYDFANAIEQAAKAQAVPEGFVLVERSKLLQILGSAVAINTNPKTKINLLESDFIIGELKAMIEAQESTND